MSESIRRTYLSLQPDGTERRYDLCTIGELTRMLRHRPVTAASLLAGLQTSELRIVARACQRLHDWRQDNLPAEHRWWESILGGGSEPEPPDRGLFEDD